VIHTGDYVKVNPMSKVYKVKAVYGDSLQLTIAPDHPDGAKYDRNFWTTRDKVIEVEAIR
jgi:hypothetical protein